MCVYNGPSSSNVVIAVNNVEDARTRVSIPRELIMLTGASIVLAKLSLSCDGLTTTIQSNVLSQAWIGVSGRASFVKSYCVLSICIHSHASPLKEGGILLKEMAQAASSST